ncbi:LysR family transcriptional regulator [bacterium]|nr:LysR family transcriptional regulator [bacterium]
MDIQRLHYFLTVAQTQNLREASELLSVSPPALSKAMKVLEDELDVSLWSRDGRGIKLTDAGKRLFKTAPKILKDLYDLRESLQKQRDLTQPVRIGTFEVFSTYFLSFLKVLEWNEQPLELHEFLPGEIEKYLIHGDIDFGITYMPIADPNLDFLKITSIEMGVFTRRGAFEGVPQQELPFVTPVMPLQGIPTKVRGLDGWPDDAYQRKVLYQVTLMESALELCRQGLVAGYFPTFVVNEHNRRFRDEFHLERRRSPYSQRVCKTDVYIVKRKSSDESKLIKQMAKAIRAICK